MRDANKFTIAVVDDDSRILESVESLLECAGHHVRLFLSAEALMASGALEDVDCLISDIGLSGMDGFELLRLVQITRPNIPVFLITGREEMSKAQSSVLLAPNRFFRKPFDGRKLLSEVADAIRKRYE